ncbi:DNA damage-induced apoptosis suppressor protein [Arvicola amphibius]|uniref:DNA damage-induced apoptosis suppressor protein n=1 Tax=Arvicola amphibius TaxID=1047088 RepID=UPI0018E3825B|nr:DNA damage-induced apoptosis suppressor protein [Arvicola amphibius]
MNRRRRFLFASVLALQNSSFIYPSCQRCFSRIVLDSQRFTCSKCGSTGKAENASYRYRLSLKVAESSRLCVVTVFGSCLDTFFGLTATGLKRYLEDSGGTPEALDRGGRQSLLTTAVENCFVGQSFVFGVTNFGDVCGHDSDPGNLLQPCCQHEGEVRTLVASQMVLPSPHVTGFTVIDYLNQLLHSSNLKKQHCDSQECSSHSLTLDHSDSDLSSRRSSGETPSSLESYGRDDFLRFWQPSLELTSTDSQVTANDDFSASEQTMASGTPNQNREYISFSKASGSKSWHEPLQSSQSRVSCVDKDNTTGKVGGELGLQADHLSPVCPSFRETRLSDSNSLFPPQMQDPFEEDNAECYSEAAIKGECPQDDIPCYQHRDIHTTTILQERSAFSLSSLRSKETPTASQTLIWDDLPFSESLNKFLEVVESEIAITETDPKDRKQVTDKGIDKFHTDSRLSVTPRRNTGALNAPPLCLRSSQAMMKENSRKETFFSNCESNPSPQIEKDSNPNKTAEPVSTGSDGSGISEWFLDTCLSALFTSPNDMEASVTQKQILQQRNEISLRPSTSTGDCSHLRNKCCNGCGEKSCSDSKGKLASLCSKKHSDVSYLHKLENKQYYRWSKNQDDNFTICRKLTYPLETLCSSPRNTNTAEEIPPRPLSSNLTQSFSADHEGSYNASADLFDDVAKNKDIETEITKMSQDVLLRWEASYSENCAVGENCSQASQKLPLQSISTSRCPRASSQSDSESDFSESQDFVPCSQSTPVAGFHRRIHGLRGTFKILPSLYSNLNVNYKKTKISPENDKRQATPAFPKNVKTPSQKSKSLVVSGLTQPEIFSHCPTAECLESDVDEWVPPTTQKVFLSDTLGLKAMCLRKCLAVHYSPDQKELPRKKLIKVTHKTNV